MTWASARRTTFMLLLLTLLAFALRVWQLDGQSLRGDEAFDVVFAQGPVSEILEELRATQPYPPAYHLFLKWWMALTGQGEFALRFPALWCSMLTIPLIYALGRLWLNEQGALSVAFLLTLQPLSIWYAQDGRMYAPLMLFSLASTCFAAQLWTGRRAKWLWAGYAVTAFVGLMTHYMALLSLAAQEVCALFVAWHDRDGRFLWRWLGIQAVMGLLYLPWLIFAWPLLRAHASSWIQPVSLPAMLWRVLQAYTVGLTLDWRWALGPSLASGIGVIVAFVALWRSHKQRELFFLFASIAVPIGLTAIGSLRGPMFDERYLVFLAAPILILVGYGLSWLAQRRWAQVVLAMLIVGGMWLSYTHYRFDPAYAKSRSWRELFAYLKAHVKAGDIVVYTFPDPAPEVYTDGRWPILILPATSPPDEDDLSRRVAQLAANYERIWLIPQWSPEWDEVGLVEDVLDAACERAAELRVSSWPLVLYHTPLKFVDEMRPLDVRLEGGVRLLGYVLRDENGRSLDRLDVRPGEEVPLTLYWQTESNLDEDYVVFTHLLDPTGWLRGQQDNQPRQGTLPTRAWTPGDWVVDAYRIPVATDAPSGDYLLEVGMYRPGDGTRLSVSGDDADPENRRILLRDLVHVP